MSTDDLTPGPRDIYPRRRSSDYGLPDWLKLSVSVAGTAITTTAIVILWVNSTFATKAELASHTAQQTVDLKRISENQKEYAEAERGTASGLGRIDARLTGIEAKMEIVLDNLPTNGSVPNHVNGKTRRQ